MDGRDQGVEYSCEEESPALAVDDVARGLAAGTISRRRAIQVGAAGALAGVASTLGLSETAWGSRGRKRVKRCRKCTGETSCKPSACGIGPHGESCVCIKATNGTKCCVVPDCTKHCDSNADCGKRQVCSKEFNTFCCAHSHRPKAGKGVCMKKCGAPH
jgi:hypothetical protein